MAWHRNPQETVRLRTWDHCRPNGTMVHLVELAEVTSGPRKGWWHKYSLCRKVSSFNGMYPSEPLGWRNWLRRPGDWKQCPDCVKIAARHPAEEGVLVP